MFAWVHKQCSFILFCYRLWSIHCSVVLVCVAVTLLPLYPQRRCLLFQRSCLRLCFFGIHTHIKLYTSKYFSSLFTMYLLIFFSTLTQTTRNETTNQPPPPFQMHIQNELCRSFIRSTLRIV